MQRKLPCDSFGRLLLPDAAIPLADFQKIYVIAIGKAAHSMVSGLMPLLPPAATFTGVVSAPTPPVAPLKNFTYFVSGHPIPNQDSWNSARAILELLRTADSRTLVIFLLSGGGSALAEYPLDPSLTLDDVKSINRTLVTCGASIEAINTIRKHVSAIKGGRLAAAAGPACKLTLAVSDVPAGRESALASGPTLPDPTTCADVHRILDDFHLRPKLPQRFVHWLDSADLPETPKPGDPAFSNSHFLLLLGMHDLFHAAHHASESHGLVACCDNSTDDWPIAAAVDSLLAQLDDLQSANPHSPVALIADGELSSPVTGNGVGGRNSAFVLACVEKIREKPITVLSAGTDGIDGNSPAAGAVADGSTASRAAALGLNPADYFARSDAFTFFDKLGDAILTGPTNNNLRDLRFLISDPRR